MGNTAQHKLNLFARKHYNYIELSLYMKMVRPEEFEVYPVNVSSFFVKQNIHILPS